MNNPFVARKGNCEVVASVFGKNPEDLFVKLDSVPPNTKRIFEIRFDLFNDHEMNSLSAIIEYMNNRKLPFVFTYRTEDPDDAMEKYSFAAENSACAIDLDIMLKGIVGKLHVKTPVILSHHGKGKWDLPVIIKEMTALQPHSYKLANIYTDNALFLNDLAAVASLRNRIENPLSFIPMGSGNTFLRIVSACLVSDFTYSMLDRESAPGQISYEQMISMIETCGDLRQR